MATEPGSPVKDKNYNLITVLQLSLQNVWMLQQYIEDTERDNNEELAKWLRQIQENNKKAGDQGKKMLNQRLQSENG